MVAIAKINQPVLCITMIILCLYGIQSFAQKPLQRYAVADKSEPGWTKPDGKPLRKRAGKKEDEPKSFERKRPSREIGTGRGKSEFKTDRGDFGAARGKRDFSDKPDRDEKPFRKPAGDFKKDFSSSVRK